MKPQDAKRLGKYLRNARSAKGWSAVALAKASGISDSNIIRLENGRISTPESDTLARLSKALDLNLADVYALADYAMPMDLPSFTPYLRTKYRDLPDDEIDKIERYAARIAKKHGVALDGPAPGADEE